MDLKLQYTYGMLVTTFMVLDQVKQIFLELYYDFLGPDSAFFYWILGFFVENLGSRKVEDQEDKPFNSLAGCRTIFNCIILIYASHALPEFQGYKVRRYPDQQPPAPPSIQPRRLELPPTFSEDQEWRKIGSRRTKFLDLGMPRFGQPKRIHVKQSSLGGSY